MSERILIVEDEQVLRESMAGLLEAEGFEVVQAAHGAEARDRVIAEGVDVIVSDIRMPEMDGITLLDHLQQIVPDTPVIMLTAYGTVENAVTAMRKGAWDYLLKPVQIDDLVMRIRRALDYGEMARERNRLTEQVAEQSTFHNLVSEAPNMMKLFGMVRKLSEVKSNVLIVGESGTGKELFARAIHYNGVTRNRPFVAVNSGAIPDSLIESELFGHRRGAFTGAVKDKQGYFEAANGGTIFLDEISTVPLAVQSTLLRVLEERVVTPVGDTRARPIDVRVVAASNRDLDEMVRSGEFREDLLYRLNVVQLLLPPLRQRKNDIPLLVHHFLQKFANNMGKPVPGISNGAMRAMLSHDWPGNVRELQNVIERAVIFAEDNLVRVEDLPLHAEHLSDEVNEDLKEALRQFERQHILYSLRTHGYDKAETALHLGIGISSLYRKMDELGIPKNPGEQPDGEAMQSAAQADGASEE
jgi:DNA-binding NtrC family response regulator